MRSADLGVYQLSRSSQPRAGHRLVPALVVVLLLCMAVPTDASAQTSPTAAFDAAMRGWMAKHNIARGSVAVMFKDRLVFAAGYGDRALNERIAVWSMSKPITGVCVAILVQEGKLSFDDPIGKLLAPVFAKHGDPGDERLRGVTVAQLLAHRSGLTESVGDNRFAPGAVQLLQQRPPSEATVDMLLPAIMQLQLAASPGARYAYSNVGFLLLGQIIEAVTGEPYERACGERVLAKAGIREPRLDPKWGRLLQATAGWALSGPEYLAFARLLSRRSDGPLTGAIHDWLRSPADKWINERQVYAYTLGVNIHTFAKAEPNIYHGGGWLWSGTYAERRGTWFVLTNAGVAWFASFDGMLSYSNPKEVGELHEALWQASRRVSSWSAHDLFAEMGVGPIAKTGEARRARK
jgi:CubicO group peptidase (beta-lactamase class C family)